MPYCMRTHTIICLLLTQKLQCFLLVYLTSDFREESVKSKQSNAMVSKSEDLMGSLLLLFSFANMLKSIISHQNTGIFIVGWMGKSNIHTTVLIWNMGLMLLLSANQIADIFCANNKCIHSLSILLWKIYSIVPKSKILFNTAGPLQN